MRYKGCGQIKWTERTWSYIIKAAKGPTIDCSKMALCYFFCACPSQSGFWSYRSLSQINKFIENWNTVFFLNSTLITEITNYYLCPFPHTTCTNILKKFLQFTKGQRSFQTYCQEVCPTLNLTVASYQSQFLGLKLWVCSFIYALQIFNDSVSYN